MDRRLDRRERRRRSRPTAATRRASNTARRAGCTAKSCASARRCGGRPTARSSRSTASTRARSRISTSRRISRRFRTRSTSRRIPSRACRIRSSICSSTTSTRRPRRKIDVRDGKEFENDVIGYYVFRVEWSPEGDELTFLRTNRRQNMLEMVACEPSAPTLPRRDPRRMADRLDRRRSGADVSSGSTTATGSSGNPTARVSRTTIYTTSRPAS